MMTMRKDLLAQNQPSEPAEAFAALIGVDWGDQSHALALLDVARGQVEASTLEHRPEAIQAWLQQLEQRFGGRPVALALEAGQGPLVQALVPVAWLTLYPIHTATSARYRTAFRPSGAKDDQPDAQVLLDLLCHHRDKLTPLRPQDEATRALDGLCQARRAAVELRTQLSNQLTSTLKGYFPQALDWTGQTLTAPVALDFLEKWPDLLTLKAARPATVRNFFYAHNVRRPQTITERLTALAAARALTTDPAVVEVRVRVVRMLVGQLRVLAKHLQQFDQAIRQAFAAHPEADLFRDLPGAGPALAPRLLTVFGTDRTRYPHADNLLKYSGLAPVKEQSGGRQWIHWRWNAPRFARQTLIEWAGQTVIFCDWARAYYQRQRRKGVGHWAALRSLAFRWVRVLWRCWMDRTPYQEARYVAALRDRGVNVTPEVAA
jgi:transposase